MAQTQTDRPDPDQILRQALAEEDLDKFGRLKIFLGYASGVGKSVRMLDEGRRRRVRGQDVVVGAIQPKATAEVGALLSSLETIPLKAIGSALVMDVPAILRRHPQVCLVDVLAYDNPSGSGNAKRWQDVEQLLSKGISIVTSLNLQYVTERRDQVLAITGKLPVESVPEEFIKTADEIVVVDAPPEMIERCAGDSVRQRQLSELRELALILAAEVVDRQLEQYLQHNGIQQLWGARERILVCITPHLDADSLIHSARRNVERFHGELYVAYVRQAGLSTTDEQALDRSLALAREAGAVVEILEGEDAVDEIVRYARSQGITQIFVGHSDRQTWWRRMFGDPLDDLIRAADGMDVRIFPH
ncbi:MAG: universal stress protein [Bryobacteraceae bacterium]